VSHLRTVVLVGAGLAGLRAAETLRREGYDGRLILLGEESGLPYDRPPLSKEVLTASTAPPPPLIRPAEGFAALDVELVCERAEALDLGARVVMTSTGRIGFDGLILATGAVPRRLPILREDSDAQVLRTYEDALRLRAGLARAEHVAIVGAGFVGLEVASSAVQLGVRVTVVELDTRPLVRTIGGFASRALLDLHAERGVEFRLGVTVASVEPGGDLALSDGSRLEADAVVVGIGVVPAVAWLASSGLEVVDGVVCDAGLGVGADDVFAAGDIANWPNDLLGRRGRTEHWLNASDQGAHAARNLLQGTSVPFMSAGYVWTDHYGHRLQFVGDASDDVVVVDGSADARRFVAWYRRGDAIVGAVAMDSPRLLMQSKRLIEQRLSWAEARAATA
jgi:NADPH-dependent 2,4-dienoyl-CoA reductase/sulfur reductase-like enzyme